MNIRIVSAEEIEKRNCMQQVIWALRDAFVELHAGSVVMPPRGIMISRDQTGRQLVTMPAVLERPDIASVKITTLTPANSARGLPLIHGTLALIDLSTGRITAIFDGAAVTAVRTGAMSGLATELFAREDAKTLAIIGAGVQARTQLEGVLAVRDIDTVFLFSRTPSSVESFAGWIAARSEFKGRVHICGSPQQAVEQADIICTATSTDSSTPLIAAEWIRAGAHINVIGGRDENACEIDPALLSTSYVIVEQNEAALSEAGEIRAAINDGLITAADIVEIGSVIAGENPVRTSPGQVTVFRSVGVAVQDTAAARVIFQELENEQRGIV